MAGNFDCWWEGTVKREERRQCTYRGVDSQEWMLNSLYLQGRGQSGIDKNIRVGEGTVKREERRQCTCRGVDSQEWMLNSLYLQGRGQSGIPVWERTVTNRGQSRVDVTLCLQGRGQ